MESWAEIERERRDLVDQVESLTEEQWRTPSLCGAWMVRDVLAHLLSPLTPGVTRRFALAMVKARGNFDRANRLLAASQARLSTPGRAVWLDHLDGPGALVLTKWAAGD
jgi:uncharacterized protein (TIGR03083 family)